MSARKVMNRVVVQGTLITVQRAVSEHTELKFAHLKVRPKLSKDDINDRQ